MSKRDSGTYVTKHEGSSEDFEVFSLAGASATDPYQLCTPRYCAMLWLVSCFA